MISSEREEKQKKIRDKILLVFPGGLTDIFQAEEIIYKALTFSTSLWRHGERQEGGKRSLLIAEKEILPRHYASLDMRATLPSHWSDGPSTAL